MDCCKLSLRHLIFTLPLLASQSGARNSGCFQDRTMQEMWGKYLNLKLSLCYYFVASLVKTAGFLRKN